MSQFFVNYADERTGCNKPDNCPDAPRGFEPMPAYLGMPAEQAAFNAKCEQARLDAERRRQAAIRREWRACRDRAIANGCAGHEPAPPMFTNANTDRAQA